MQGSILYAHAPSYIFMPLLYSLHIHPPFKMSTTEFLYKQSRVSINQWIDKTVKNHIIALNVKWKTNTAAPPPHPLHSLVHPQRQNCKGKSLKDRSWQEAEKNVTSWKSGRDEPCSRCVCVCVCVCFSADCELIRCLLIPYLSHLYFLAPFNPSS